MTRCFFWGFFSSNPFNPKDTATPGPASVPQQLQADKSG